jgi:hypothetical protein
LADFHETWNFYILAMRLLEHMADGQLVLREYLSRDIPPYAILSHTWGKEEVDFQEAHTGRGKNNEGWKKIEFCAKQADADGLRYVWVDTCCVDKQNSVEISEAINSMFRWYQKAARCYVYLSDVSVPDAVAIGQSEWEHAFRTSRWFTRAWTLQELIAPSLVVFYSLEGKRLGDKSSLATVIRDITGIPRNSFQGHALSDFSISERINWAKGRQTTIDEDQIYSLLGIFDVSMPIIYGEGRESAYRRLGREIQKSYKGKVLSQVLIVADL